MFVELTKIHHQTGEEAGETLVNFDRIAQIQRTTVRPQDLGVLGADPFDATIVLTETGQVADLSTVLLVKETPEEIVTLGRRRS